MPALRRLGLALYAGLVLCTGLLLAAAQARADALEALREFTREVKTGRANFTQTVSSPDGSRRKTSSGHFEFARPDRFRFVYSKPFEQQIVADGRKVWLYDADLNQVTVRAMSTALGATPVALLAGASIDKDFVLSAAPTEDGLDWVLAQPRAKDGAQVQSLRIGFRGKALAGLDIVDAFGQRSQLRFSQVEANLRLADEAFHFVVPKGVDLIESP